MIKLIKQINTSFYNFYILQEVKFQFFHRNRKKKKKYGIKNKNMFKTNQS